MALHHCLQNALRSGKFFRQAIANLQFPHLHEVHSPVHGKQRVCPESMKNILRGNSGRFLFSNVSWVCDWPLCSACFPIIFMSKSLKVFHFILIFDLNLTFFTHSEAQCSRFGETMMLAMNLLACGS
mmetsp:Transcript_11668/g.18960  ORF Transcript_11668/g.18960 Transcript_11668/m.18960 type:complete len:127 (-) Transcript_11668:24-404(-)